jgi:hypothetical protein
MRRARFLALVAGCLGAALPAVASAALLWTLVATPLTATVNVSTTFTLTATNLDPLTELGCLEVDLPASFVIDSLGTPTASNGDTWSSSRSGNAVIVHSLSGGGRLQIGQSVQFVIRAHGTLAGVFQWPNHAHRPQDCSKTEQPGTPLQVTVLPAILATPAPTPTPKPTPLPTSTPRPTAAPTATPIPLPSLPLPTIGLPVLTPAPSPSPTPQPTVTPEPSASSAEGAAPGAAPPPPGGAGSGSSGQTFQLARVANDETSGGSGVDMGVEVFGLSGTSFLWAVPAATVALPGLLVILFVVLQAVGALAWIPFVRRMEEERPTPAGVSRSG